MVCLVISPEGKIIPPKNPELTTDANGRITVSMVAIQDPVDTRGINNAHFNALVTAVSLACSPNYVFSPDLESGLADELRQIHCTN